MPGYLLTSTSKNLRHHEWRITGPELGIAPDIPWSVHKYTLHGGRQEDVDVIVVDTGRLAVTVVPTRGMGVLEAISGDLLLGWNSPVREVVHPRHVDLAAGGGTGWLEGFNEWLVRCGLASCGAPGHDPDTNSDLTLHGRIANLPASEVEVLVEETAPHRIHVRGRVDERSMFGPQLELWAGLTLIPGTRHLRVEDTVTNRDDAPREFQLLYHVNFGPPLLGEGTRFEGPIADVSPRDDRAAEGLDTWDTHPAPTPGFAEQVYFLSPSAGADGATRVMLTDPTGTRSVSMAYRVGDLPCLALWKNAAPLASGYVTGIEPGTSSPNPRHVERRAGRVPTLAAGESRRFVIDVKIHEGEPEVAAARRAIAALRPPDG